MFSVRLEPTRLALLALFQESMCGTGVRVVSAVGQARRRMMKFETDPAYVRVNAGVTKNLGNYESLRVDVSLTVPCYVEEMEKVQKRTATLVADMLDEEVEQYLGKGD